MADQRVNGNLVLIGSLGGTVALGAQASGGGFTYLLPTDIPQVGQFLRISSVFNGNTATAQWVFAGNISVIFGASGPSHSSGAVPDPGAVAGTARFLREDATWAAPSVGSFVSTFNGRT